MFKGLLQITVLIGVCFWWGATYRVLAAARVAHGRFDADAYCVYGRAQFCIDWLDAPYGGDGASFHIVPLRNVSMLVTPPWFTLELNGKPRPGRVVVRPLFHLSFQFVSCFFP